MSQTEKKLNRRLSQSNVKREPWEPSPFRLVSVEKTDVPQGGDNHSWYNYVLDNTRSQIVGTHRGSLKAVTAYATRYAAELNARVVSGHSAWSPRAKKAT